MTAVDRWNRCGPLFRALGGTAGENDMVGPRRRQLQAGPGRGPSWGDHRLVGKSAEGSRQPGGETRTPLRLPAPPEVRGL
jgi:hypothetical protein